MREHKFRAWDKKASKMFFVGDIAFYDDEDRENNKMGYVKDSMGGEIFYEFPLDVILMQYTGLKDKNACVYENEIYEGDILAINQIGVGEDNIREVSFENGGFYIGGKWSLWEILINNKKVKVIGNIYENPELNKEKK